MARAAWSLGHVIPLKKSYFALSSFVGLVLGRLPRTFLRAPLVATAAAAEAEAFVLVR